MWLNQYFILLLVSFQMEFYFSDANLSKDRFLKKEIDQTDDGCKALVLA